MSMLGHTGEFDVDQRMSQDFSDGYPLHTKKPQMSLSSSWNLFTYFNKVLHHYHFSYSSRTDHQLLTSGISQKLCCLLLSCVWFHDPVDCSPPGSSVHGISQARILEWIATSFSMGSSWPTDQTRVSRIAGRFFTVWDTRVTSLQMEPRTKLLMLKVHTSFSTFQDFFFFFAFLR